MREQTFQIIKSCLQNRISRFIFHNNMPKSNDVIKLKIVNLKTKAEI